PAEKVTLDHLVPDATVFGEIAPDARRQILVVLSCKFQLFGHGRDLETLTSQLCAQEFPGGDELVGVYFDRLPCLKKTDESFEVGGLAKDKLTVPRIAPVDVDQLEALGKEHRAHV